MFPVKGNLAQVYAGVQNEIPPNGQSWLPAATEASENRLG